MNIAGRPLTTKSAFFCLLPSSSFSFFSLRHMLRSIDDDGSCSNSYLVIAHHLPAHILLSRTLPPAPVRHVITAVSYRASILEPSSCCLLLIYVSAFRSGFAFLDWQLIHFAPQGVDCQQLLFLRILNLADFLIISRCTASSEKLPQLVAAPFALLAASHLSFFIADSLAFACTNKSKQKFKQPNKTNHF